MKLIRMAGQLICSLSVCSAIAAHATDLPLVGDAHVNSARPSTNYAASSNLYVGNGSTSYLQFDTTTLPAGTTSAQVTKATLIVFVNRINTSSAVSVSQLTSTWSEATVTYTSRPTAGAALSTFTPATAGVYVAIDVTSAVQGWVAGTSPNDGLSLSSAGGDLLFDSKENDETAHPARLDVTVATPVPTLGGGTLTYGAGTSGAFTINNTNPQAPSISGVLPAVVQSVTVGSTTGNTTGSVTVDNTTNPAIPKYIVNFPATTAATPKFPNIELNTTVTTTESFLTQDNTNESGTLVTFSSANNANAKLTGGNTWDGSTFTVGSTGAGTYRFNVQLRGSSGGGQGAATVGIFFFLDKNGTNNSPNYTNTLNPVYQSSLVAVNNKNSAVIVTTLFLTAGDKISFYGTSASTVVYAYSSTDGSSNITIARVK